MENERSEWVSQKQAVEEYLLSNITFWRERRNGNLPWYRVRGKIIYKRSDLDAYMERNKRNSEVPANA